LLLKDLNRLNELELKEMKMAKFNTSNKGVNSIPNSENKEGFPAFERTDVKKEFVSIIMNSLLISDSYYETEQERMKNIESFFSEEDLDFKKFLAKAMVYVRNEGNLRSVSHLLAVLVAERFKGFSFTKRAFYKTLIRPDDATEIVALWNQRNPGKMIPNSLRKAIKMALETKWDKYQLKKYFGNGSVKVSNLINISHPTPTTDEQRLMFKQALEGRLPSIQTAQTVNAGSEDRISAYKDMLKNNKLGYMAALKNVKNILEAGPDRETIDLLVGLLGDENRILKSRVLPFRFAQAYETVKRLDEVDPFFQKKVMNVIEEAFKISGKNLNLVNDGERVALLLDESASMGSGYVFSKSPFSLGKVMMASMISGLDKDNVIGYLWATTPRRVEIDSPMNFITNTYSKGGGTNLSSAVSELVKKSIFVDKLIIFTDMQENEIGTSWGGNGVSFNDTMKEYRKINPKVKVLFWNLEGYGNGTPLKLNDNVLEVTGYSDRMLKIIPKIWNDKDALVKEIESIEL